MIRSDDISLRQFGPAFDRKCADPATIVCARFECQTADRCAKSTQQAEPARAGV